VRTIVTLLVAANPPAVAAALRGAQPRREMAVAAAIAAALAGTAALLSGPALDALDVSPASFQVAAAVVLGVAGVRWLVVGPWRLPDGMAVGGWRDVAVPLLFPVLVTPQVVVVSTSLGADHGVGPVVVGAAAASALVWAAAVARARPLLWSAASRFVGMGAVVLALALATDGIKTV
jgi:small neutral amino acid transporter SnatA (MarC family)